MKSHVLFKSLSLQSELIAVSLCICAFLCVLRDVIHGGGGGGGVEWVMTALIPPLIALFLLLCIFDTMKYCYGVPFDVTTYILMYFLML